MSGGEHTPGPWSWDAGIVPPDGPERYADIYIDGGETIIAAFNDSIPEGRANARLIAAAPTMLAALKGARRLIAVDRNTIFECSTVTGDPATLDEMDGQVVADYDALLARIDAAIAAAEGEDAA